MTCVGLPLRREFYGRRANCGAMVAFDTPDGRISLSDALQPYLGHEVKMALWSGSLAPAYHVEGGVVRLPSGRCGFAEDALKVGTPPAAGADCHVEIEIVQTHGYVVHGAMLPAEGKGLLVRIEGGTVRDVGRLFEEMMRGCEPSVKATVVANGVGIYEDCGLDRDQRYLGGKVAECWMIYGTEGLQSMVPLDDAIRRALQARGMMGGAVTLGVFPTGILPPRFRLTLPLKHHYGGHI